MKKWTELVNKFSEDCKVIEENKELQMLLLCDSMRIGVIFKYFLIKFYFLVDKLECRFLSSKFPSRICNKCS